MKVGINIIIEAERHKDKTVFIASSPDINVLAEGNSIDEARGSFIAGVKNHLRVFPEERKALYEEAEERFVL